MRHTGLRGLSVLTAVIMMMCATSRAVCAADAISSNDPLALSVTLKQHSLARKQGKKLSIQVCYTDDSVKLIHSNTIDFEL